VTATQLPRLSIVLPLYNEVETVERLATELFRVLDGVACTYTVVFVDDGSIDGTGAALDRLHDRYAERVTVVHLSRNFGHQAALTAGMDYAEGDAVICMDGDLQHPPSLIPALLERWQQGFDIVQAVRRETPNVGWFKNLTARVFYGVMNRLSATHIEPGGCDFRLVSRRVAEVFRTNLRERDRFVRGLVSWVGFPSCRVEFDAADRYAGRTKYSVMKMVSFARLGLVSFSKVPLKTAVLIGMLVSSLSLLYGLYAIFAFVHYRTIVMPGWASTVLVGTFLGGCQLFFLGLLGEYIATIFDEIKGRPIYLVSEVRPASTAAARSEPTEAAVAATPAR
jgi:polyisoprenyl-phosphate glycosyltransferase